MMSKKTLSLLLFLCTSFIAKGQNSPLNQNVFPKELVNWVKKNAYRIDSIDPENYATELTFLDDLIRNEKLILLGEGTHGTKEIFQIKDKIARYLIKKKGFSKLGIEYDMVNGFPVNDYIHQQSEDLYLALNQQRGWVWNTEEIAQMIKWMREENASGTSIEYFGVDVFQLIKSAEMACSYLQEREQQEVELVLDYWQQLLGKELSYYVENRSAFYNHLDTASLNLNYQLVELMQLLVDLFENNQDKLILKSEQRDWKMNRQLAKTALIRSKHLLQFRMNYIFGTEDWSQELNFFRSFSKKIDTLKQELQLLNDTILYRNLNPIVTKIQNPFKGRNHYLTNLSFQKRNDWKDVIQRAIQRINIRKTLYENQDSSANFLKIQMLLKDVAKLLKFYNNYFDKPLERINARELGLADNTTFLTELDEHGTIIWAHNLHVTKIQSNTRNDGDKMGTFLKQRFGDDMLVIGTFFGSGTLQAWDYSGPTRKLNIFEVPPAKLGSLEDLFAEAACDVCLLDLRKLPQEGVAHDWFTKKQAFRSIGNYYEKEAPEDFFMNDVIVDHFDLLVYIKETNKATPTPLSKEKYFNN